MSARALPRHIVVTGPRSTFRYERCPDHGCHVAPDGTASGCGEDACPACGSGGANVEGVVAATCSICGNVWLMAFEPELRATA